jgi:hypothetical protein
VSGRSGDGLLAQLGASGCYKSAIAAPAGIKENGKNNCPVSGRSGHDRPQDNPQQLIMRKIKENRERCRAHPGS